MAAEVALSTASPAEAAPDWDLEQLEVILDRPSTWQLVTAGPGSGKSAVACQRVAYLIDEGVPPSRILLVSFTRTAVAELRQRIVAYAVAGERARGVRISTIDSQAWSLRTGFDDEPLPQSLTAGGYDISIARTVELFRQRNADLIDFMGRLEHLIIDEAQDVMNGRADLVVEMLRCISETCGVTVLADPAQAIYGFTSDNEGEGSTSGGALLSRLATESPRPFVPRTLTKIHRVRQQELIDVFLRTRKEIELAQGAPGHVARVRKTIRDTCGNDVGVTSYENVAEFLSRVGDSSTLVLFRRRADVLFASSYCSGTGIQHRLRMSELPSVVRPWIGWLFYDAAQSLVNREAFSHLWEARASITSAPFEGENRDEAWQVLHRLAAGPRAGTIDLVHLRSLVARTRPPVDLCHPDLGGTGPILGTIHASKGREADTVVLVMPPPGERQEDAHDGSDSASVFEEGRVYYVGATRARKMLVAAGNAGTRVAYLDSKRVFRFCGQQRAQVEFGREGDVDRVAHLAWSGGVETQRVLASCAGSEQPVEGRAIAEQDYAVRLILKQKGADGVTRHTEIGQMSPEFPRDLWKVAARMSPEHMLKPSTMIPHLHLVAVATIGLKDDELSSARSPFSQSGIGLAPIVKGFPMIQFFHRHARGSR